MGRGRPGEGGGQGEGGGEGEEGQACEHVFPFQMEMKLMLCRLVQEYAITLPSDYKLIVVEQFIRQSHDDIVCTLVPRK